MKHSCTAGLWNEIHEAAGGAVSCVVAYFLKLHLSACIFAYLRTAHSWILKDNEAWLVMDFVGGGSVSDILEACEVTLSEPEARECAAWTVLSLDYLHSNRKLHRVRTDMYEYATYF